MPAEEAKLRVLAVGDVVGKLGRRTLALLLPELRRQYGLDLVIVNGENAAGGKGLTAATAQEILAAGADVITSGNHIWTHREIYPLLESDWPILRPLNYPQGAPGRGVWARNGIAVVNLQGRVFMPHTIDCPFRAIDRALEELAGARVIIVDMHAEATSEKVALGFYLDGRVSAVVGTHTHVPTADARILPRGTAYVSDLGMTGGRHSVIGMEIGPVMEHFLTQLPARFVAVEEGPSVLNAVMIEVDEATGRALSIQRMDREVE
jgi:metallophosphoesterase (TIGR00282 family)